MRRRLIPVAAAALLAAVALPANAHLLDHPAPEFQSPSEPLSTAVNAGGENAEWELVTSIPTGNPHSDLDFFTHKGDTYASVGTLAAGPNAGGQTILRLTEGGEVKPSYVTGHPSASCVSTTTSATGLQHDVEATPKGSALPQQINPHIVTGDAQLLVESSDGEGRCHDQGAFGQNAPLGGLEIIDITDPAAPKEIALTVHIGEAHTVNVDPKRPHIAFDVTQDGVTIKEDGTRSNETGTSTALDGFEVVDMSSCMNFPAGTPIQAKRAACRPEVYRYRYPDPAIARSHTYPALQGCHELEIYPDDTVTCAAIDATAVFDLSGAFDDNGTPTDFTDDKPRGTPLPCRVRESTSAGGAFGTGAPIIDCHIGGTEENQQSLIVSEWLKIGAPSLEGVRWVGTVPHMGFGATADIVDTPYDAPEDILAAHESELTQSGRFVITSDERGGGVVPGGASCDAGDVNVRGNGGLHAFPIGSFTTNPPTTAEESWNLWGRDSEGNKAVYRAQTRTGAAGDFCTAHVFQQIPGQNRIFMGWYSQGTEVVDFTENRDGTIDFEEAGWFTPEGANTWTSHVFKVQRNPDGTFTYWGATGDGILPGTGRSTIDVYKVTLPAPPKPLPQEGETIRAPRYPTAGGQLAPCARTSAFERVQVKPRRRGLAFRFAQRGNAPVKVSLVRQSRGRKPIKAKRVKRFKARRGSFDWNGRGAGRGFYVAQFRARTPAGGSEVRRVALQRKRARWKVLPAFHQRRPCGLIDGTRLSRPLFGGRGGSLVVTFKLGESADVEVQVRRGRKVVKTVPKRMYAAGPTNRLKLLSGKARRGRYRVVVSAARPGKTASATLHARRPQPLMTPIGLSRATRAARPARSTTSTTRSTSL